MEHLQVKAAATVTDQGEFSAIAATYAVDRVGDRIVPGAFEKTITAWQTSGKQLPLHWEHGGNPEDIIGAVDPKSMRETSEGLYVEGRIDLEGSEKAREAWRSMKNNALSLSFGYLAVQEKKSGDVNELHEIDLFEITVCSGPINADTRFLSLKAARAELGLSSEASADIEEVVRPDAVIPEEKLRRRTSEEARKAALGWEEIKALVEEAPEETISDQELAEAKRVLLFLKQNELEPDALDIFEKTAWTANYVSDLPDSAFLHVEDGERRHFPVKGADGNVDLPHLKNALACIPRSDLSQSVKDRLTTTAQGMLADASKALNPEPPETKSDELRSRTFDLALSVANDGMKVPKHIEVEEPEPEEPISAAELRRRSYELALDIANS